MKELIGQYVPMTAVDPCYELLRSHQVRIKVVNHRVTKHGDYRKLPSGFHQITINASLNPYRFLITLIHEIAHLLAFEHYGRMIKPHGPEWKQTFKELMLPFLPPEIFPSALLPLLAKHFINPKASSSTDAKLSLALNQFDGGEAKTYLLDLPRGSVFSIHNGKQFEKGSRRVKRFECKALDSGRVYLFQPHTEVEHIGT
ncbi:MAG: SprT-like domain-containing protein [Eudoraea sp.]|nr:SprT-like domain-containing protein [Eudoraea sp.]NNK29373.1 sprT domain-containing protein [Flavobacteriaceae bacterium]